MCVCLSVLFACVCVSVGGGGIGWREGVEKNVKISKEEKTKQKGQCASGQYCVEMRLKTVTVIMIITIIMVVIHLI